MKTALVTGGAGFVGTNLIKKLLSIGYKVVSIDNYSTGVKSNHQKGAEYHEHDICNITDFSSFGKYIKKTSLGNANLPGSTKVCRSLPINFSLPYL